MSEREPKDAEKLEAEALALALEGDAGENAPQDALEAAARKALFASLEAEVPAGVQPNGARAVRQDIYFRLALIELGSGRPEEALAFAERGLRLGEREELFTANLLVAQGRSEEALARDVEAAESYHRALKINKLLLEREMAAQGHAP